MGIRNLIPPKCFSLPHLSLSWTRPFLSLLLVVIVVALPNSIFFLPPSAIKEMFFWVLAPFAGRLLAVCQGQGPALPCLSDALVSLAASDAHSASARRAGSRAWHRSPQSASPSRWRKYHSCLSSHTSSLAGQTSSYINGWEMSGWYRSRWEMSGWQINGWEINGWEMSGWDTNGWEMSGRYRSR